MRRRNAARSETVAQFLSRISSDEVKHVSGTGVFLTRLGKNTPPLIVNYVKQTRSVYQTIVALTVSFESVPRVKARDRVRYEKLCDGFWHVIVHFGFVEIPDLPSVISQAKREGLPAWENPTYYVERYDVISRTKRSFVSRWRVALFAFMSRNSVHAIDRFRIPTSALVEIGRRIEL